MTYAPLFTEVVGSAIGVFIALRLVLPFQIEVYVNHQLDKTPDYAGHVGDVNVHLWRRAFKLN